VGRKIGGASCQCQSAPALRANSNSKKGELPVCSESFYAAACTLLVSQNLAHVAAILLLAIAAAAIAALARARGASLCKCQLHLPPVPIEALMVSTICGRSKFACQYKFEFFISFSPQ